jgi:hypothetical protein
MLVFPKEVRRSLLLHEALRYAETPHHNLKDF